MSIMTNISPLTPGYQVLPFQAGIPMAPQAVLGSTISGVAGSCVPFQAIPQIPVTATQWVSSPISLTAMAQPIAQPVTQMLPQGAVGTAIVGQAELSGSLSRLSGSFMPLQQTPQMAAQCLMSDWVGTNRFLPVMTPTSCTTF